MGDLQAQWVRWADSHCDAEAETADFQPVASNDISVSDAPPVEAGYERSPATSHEKSAVVQQGVLRYLERHELAGGTIKLELPD